MDYAMNEKVPQTLPTDINSLIVEVRGQKVILDSDLASALWRADQTPQRAGQAERAPVSPGLPVSANG